MERSIKSVRWVRIRAFVGAVMYLCLGLRAPIKGFSLQKDFQGENDDQKQASSWTLLSREQFPSELKGHEFALCIAALPWCGEARSLMKGIQKVVKDDNSHSLPGLQLFYVHRPAGNLVLGDPSPPSITLYRYGIPYRYGGRRTASAIMTSIQQSVPVLRSRSLFSNIESVVELEDFVDSTDKAVLLIELCGWGEQLRHISNDKEGDGGEDEHMHSVGNVDDIESREDSQTVEDTNGQVTREDTNSRKPTPFSSRAQEGELQRENVLSSEVAEQGYKLAANGLHGAEAMLLLQDGKRVGEEIDSVSDCLNQDPLYCVSGNNFKKLDDASILVSRDISTVNLKDAVDADHLDIYHESLCNTDEFDKFRAVYHNVSQLAADSLLTPLRTRFATITNQEVVSQAGISTHDLPWLLMYHIRDLDQHAYFYDGVGDVEEFLSDHSAPLVTELYSEQGYEITSSFSNEVPSLILFVDRISNEPGIREESKDALAALQTVSYHYASLARIERDNEDLPSESQGEERDTLEPNENVIAAENVARVLQKVVDSPSRSTQLTSKEISLETGSLPRDDGVLEAVSRIGGEEEATISVEGHTLSPTQLQRLAGRVPVGSDTSSSSCQVLDGTFEAEDSNLHTSIHDSNSLLSGGQDSEGKSIAVEGVKHVESKVSLDKLSLEEPDLGDSTEACKGHFVPKENSEAARVSSESTHDSDVPGNDRFGSSNGPAGEVELTGDRTLLLGTTRKITEPQACNPELEQQCDDQHMRSGESKGAQDVGFSQIQEEQKQSDGNWNELNFFFVDGGDYTKEKLIRSKATPALVLIDPQAQAHYVFPSNGTFNVTSLVSFIDAFLSGDLKRTVSSEPQRPAPRLPPGPPFVNRDFHKTNPVPRVSVDSFSKLVTGFQRTDVNNNQFVCQKDARFSFREDGVEEFENDGGNRTESAWDKDVLVLFTTSWCGFCTRMELVVWEVHRSLQLIKSHEVATGESTTKAAREGNSNNPAKATAADCSGDECATRSTRTEMKLPSIDLPVILQMDCSWNDCSEQLGDILEEETYPAVVLFPNRNKLSPIVYNGAPTVRGVFSFLKAHAASFVSKRKDHVCNDEGADVKATTFPRSDGRTCDALESSTSIKISSSPGTRSLPESEVLFWQLNSEHEDMFRRSFVGSLLLASEKLSVASTPFAKAVVLIVSMPSTNMVHGLMLNKALTWRLVPGLDDRIDALLNTAAIGYGGPIMDSQRPLLILTRVHGLEGFVEVVSGLYYGFLRPKGNLLEMIRSGSLRAKDFWFFLGYSSWTWHQLQNELYQDLWDLREFSINAVRWPQQWSG